MEEKKRSKILEILNSKLVIIFLVFGLFFITTIFAGDMIFEGGSLNVSNILHIDESSGYVGIGTDNPDNAKLEILSEDNQLKLSYDSDNSAVIRTDIEGNLYLSPEGDEVLVFKQLEIYGASRVSVYANSSQSIPDTTVTTLEFDTEIEDNLGEFADNKFTANKNGYYLVIGQAGISGLSDQEKWYVYIYKNGDRVSFAPMLLSGNLGMNSDTMKMLYLEAGDYVELKCYHNHGSSVNTVTGEAYTYFNVHRLS